MKAEAMPCFLQAEAYSVTEEQSTDITWALVKGFNLSYHNKETLLFTILKLP